MVTTNKTTRILLTGATGYVGGRLLRRLEASGYRVRCMARNIEGLRHRTSGSVEVVVGDVLDPPSLAAAMEGVQFAFYLVHSMGSNAFEAADRAGARNFAAAARAARVEGIIYLGGLASEREELSAHLRSRHEVGEILRDSGVPVLEFRASIIIGSGSLSFEMIRSLVERLPVMITPRWVTVTAQPIAIDDVLDYMLAALRLPVAQYRIYEIGGADRVSYADIMRAYARQRGLRPRMLPVPVLTPWLSSLWLGLVTPLYARIGRKLIESIVHPTVVHDPTARSVFDIQPMGIDAAIQRALAHEDQAFAETYWANAMSSVGDPQTWGGVRFGARLVDSRSVTTNVSPAAAFAPIERIGGETGWYALNSLWRLRGYLDVILGGVGFRRGRPHPSRLKVGDVVDFWRVEAFEPDRRLRLAAEMKVPGRAWLEFEVTGDGAATTIRQTAMFDPVGLRGLLYWYALFPLHRSVFARMLSGIAHAAATNQGSHSTPASDTIATRTDVAVRQGRNHEREQDQTHSDQRSRLPRDDRK